MSDQTVELPIDGFLDLHTFRPAEVRSLVPDYLVECRIRGISSVCIIHGKGSGTLRKLVHSVLDRLDFVESYRLSADGNWGKTLVDLKAMDAE